MLYGNVPFKGGNMKELHKQIIDSDYTLKDDISEGKLIYKNQLLL
jgi:hypothetical protein